MKTTTEAPVLFVTFNRPDTTRVVFEVIRQVKPKKLYISSDGPRKNRYEEDWSNISQCRALAAEVDWDCTVHTRFLEDNLGCGLGVSGAISWAFENEERMIIVEDDCVPSFSFFTFCNDMLEKYKDNERIMSIAGTRWSQEYPIEDCDYFYSRYANIWGWATWKRAWNLYDYYMTDYPLFKEKKILDIVQEDNAPLIKRWLYLFDGLYEQTKKHTWDYQWQYAVYKYNGLAINATKNLVTNIGMVGMHSGDDNEFYHNRQRYEISAPYRAPAFPYPEYGFDAYHGRKFFLRDRNDLKLLYDHATSKLSMLLNK